MIEIMLLWACVAIQVFLYATEGGAFILANLVFCLAVAGFFSIMIARK